MANMILENSMKKEENKMSNVDKGISSDKDKISLFRGYIVLNKNITRINYLCSQIEQMLMVFIFTVTDTLQPMILIDKEYYNIDKAQAGTVNAQLLFYDLPLRLITAPLYGTLCDIFGRRVMLIYGVLCVTIGYILVPMRNDVWPWYLLCRLIITNGGICILVTPLNADYVHNSAKGRGAGLSYTIGAFGALLGSITSSILITLEFNFGQIYFMLGIAYIVIQLLFSMGIKGGTEYFKNEDTFSPVKDVDYTLGQKIASALEDAKKNPWINIAFILNALGSADYYIYTTIFVIYLKSFYPNTENFEQIANAKANYFQSIFFGVSLIFCIFYGYLIDRVKHIKLLSIILFITILGFSIIPFVQDPDDSLLKLMMLFTSIGLPGVFTFACYTAIRHFPKQHRGILTGFVGIFAVLGVIAVMVAGGYLFDTWDRSGPFVLYDCLLILSLILILYIYITRIKNTKYDEITVNDQILEMRNLTTE